MTAVLCSKQIWNLSFWLFNCWKCTNFHSMIINDHCKLHSFSSCHDHSSVTLVKVITLNYFCFVSPLYLNQQSAPAGMTWKSLSIPIIQRIWNNKLSSLLLPPTERNNWLRFWRTDGVTLVYNQVCTLVLYTKGSSLKK